MTYTLARLNELYAQIGDEHAAVMMQLRRVPERTRPAFMLLCAYGLITSVVTTLVDICPLPHPHPLVECRPAVWILGVLGVLILGVGAIFGRAFGDYFRYAQLADARNAARRTAVHALRYTYMREQATVP